jgi:hypothetical protein
MQLKAMLAHTFTLTGWLNLTSLGRLQVSVEIVKSRLCGLMFRSWKCAIFASHLTLHFPKFDPWSYGKEREERVVRGREAWHGMCRNSCRYFNNLKIYSPPFLQLLGQLGGLHP